LAPSSSAAAASASSADLAAAAVVAQAAAATGRVAPAVARTKPFSGAVHGVNESRGLLLLQLQKPLESFAAAEPAATGLEKRPAGGLH